MSLDGLEVIKYNVGGAVDISAPLAGAGRQYLATISDIDRSTLTVDEWARRKNANFRTASVVIGLTALDLAMSLKVKAFDDQSTIEAIGRYMARGQKEFWTVWGTKMLIGGLVFSRVFPWAERFTNPNVQLRYSDEELRPR